MTLQSIAVSSLRKGLEKYDQRKGWKGPLANKEYKNWRNSIDSFKLEKSINWEIAIVKKINKFSTAIETEKKIEGIISYENISWTKKEFKGII